jgi:hypothetical protein
MWVCMYRSGIRQQLAGEGQLFRGAGRGETRGDRVVQTTLAVPAFDQRLALDVARSAVSVR